MRHKQIDLAEQLRAAFSESGLTRFAWAKQAGVGYAVVHRFTSGERDVTLATASKLASVLGFELQPVGSQSKRKATTGRKRKG